MNTRIRTPFGSHLVDASACTSINEVLTLAGLDFTVEKATITSSILTPNGVTTVEYPDDRGIVAHKSDGTIVPFRTVGGKYTVIQNEDVFAPVQQLWDEGFISSIDQAGHLGDGQRVFLLANLTSECKLDDPHQRKLMITTAHDGGGAVVVQGWATRLHCANQIPMVVRNARKGGIFRLAHTKSATQYIAGMRQAIQSAITVLDQYDDTMLQLMAHEVTREETQYVLDSLFPINPEKMTDRQQNAAMRKRNMTKHLALYSDTNENIRGTAAALFQAAVEWSDYFSDGKRSQRILRGTDVDFKTRALDVVSVLV